MNELAVVTPSYRPDAELFAELHRSVLAHTSEQTVHHVIVPASDIQLFDHFAGPRCRVWSYPELLPRRYVATPRPGWWVHLRRPWPPVRGWIMQQALKIAAAAVVEADTVLLADSDVVLVRPTPPTRFMIDGRLRLVRVEDAVHASMERHVRWHQVARRLLGLPEAPPPPLADYVSALNVWDPAIVRAMQDRIVAITGRAWIDVVTSELHFSEFILYGVFVDEFLDTERRPPALDIDFCHVWWDRVPLTADSAREFVNRMPLDAVAMMISAKSDTPQDVRLAAIRESTEIAGNHGPEG